MPPLSSEDRSLVARIASNTRWALEADRAAATAPGRRAFLESFEKHVDPDGRLDPAERERRAAALRRAHFARMALKSAQARRAKRRFPTADSAA